MTYTGNNRTHMIRIPDAGRFEFRLADGAANPYCHAGRHPGRGSRWHRAEARSRQAPRHQHVYRGPQGKDAKKLPLNLLDALRALEASSVLRDGLGEQFVSAYLKLKHADWNEYAAPSDRVGAAHHARLLG